MMLAAGPVVLGHPAQRVERLRAPRAWSRPARQRSTSAICSASTRWSTFRMFSISPSPVSGEGAVSVKQLTPTTCCSPVSMRRTRSAWLRTSRILSSSMASKAPPSASTSASSAPAASTSSAVLASITLEPSKMSPYSRRSDSKARICWMRSDHCWSQGRGRPEGLVPRRQLHGPGPGALRQGDPEGLEHDARHVVLGLLLGQAERVHLHAVAEAAQLGVVDAVALAADAVPHGGEGPHLAGLLHEADARVDEEADPADHRGELGRVDLARVAHAVEHADGGGQGVGHLLDRRGPRLLQVVAADVDRVPLGHVAHRVGDGVDGQAQAGPGREDVGAPAQVLLDDVVLRGPRRAARRRPPDPRRGPRRGRAARPRWR